MTDNTEELEALRIHVKRLERENKALRQTLLDDFAKAALASLNGWGEMDYPFDEAAHDCFAMAAAMLEVRSEIDVT